MTDTRFQPDSAEAWAVLYLHDWDPPKEGQEHRWEPGKNVFPEIHNIYLTLQEADAVRRRMSDPNKYWVCRVHIPAPAVSPREPDAWRVDGLRNGKAEIWFYYKPEWPTMHEEHGDKVTPLYAALPSEAIGREWQPIETAPKGETILGFWINGEQHTGSTDGERWFPAWEHQSTNWMMPSLWMPLIEPDTSLVSRPHHSSPEGK